MSHATAMIIKNAFRRFNSVSVIKVKFDPTITDNLCVVVNDKLVNKLAAPIRIGGVSVQYINGVVVAGVRFPQYRKLIDNILGHFLQVMDGVPCTADQAKLTVVLMKHILNDFDKALTEEQFEELFIDSEAVDEIATLTAERNQLRADVAAAAMKYSITPVCVCMYKIPAGAYYVKPKLRFRAQMCRLRI
jgi:hypothetical protein